MKVFNHREIVRVMHDNGYRHTSTSGSHEKWEKSGCRPIVLTTSKEVNRMLWQRIVKENNLICQF